MEVAPMPPTPRPRQVTLVGDAEAAPAACAAAERIGAFCAQHGLTLVTGGRGGVMEAASRGAAQLGGLVVGILPSADFAEANPWCSVVVPTGIGWTRNSVNALSGDVVVAIGGGAGTLSELAYAWIYGRPILTLAGTGGWVDKLAGAPLDHRNSSRIVHCASVQELEAALRVECGLPA
jgi:uncharacterized protein (TIGR00725 family)